MQSSSEPKNQKINDPNSVFDRPSDMNMGLTHCGTVSGLFDDLASADNAVLLLIDAGVDRSRISIIEGNDPKVASKATPETPGLLETLKDLVLPAEDRGIVAQPLNRDGYLVSVRTEPTEYAKVADILDEGIADLVRRESEWRAQGWKGYDQPREQVPIVHNELDWAAADVTRELAS